MVPLFSETPSSFIQPACRLFPELHIREDLSRGLVYTPLVEGCWTLMGIVGGLLEGRDFGAKLYVRASG